MMRHTLIPSNTAEANRLIEKWVTPDDYAGAESRPTLSRKHDFLLTRAALREVLNEMTSTNDWSFGAEANGRPLAFSTQSGEAPHISLSHTDGMIAVAVSLAHPVGIDIEKWRARDFNGIAAYAFNKDEAMRVVRDGQTAFYRLWTLKEAQAKALGVGIFTAIDNNISALTEWDIYYEEPCPGYSLSVVTKK